MTIVINTSDSKRVEVSLKEDGKIVDNLFEHNEYGSQVLLPLIEKILKNNKLKYIDLKEVEVSTGPGSFTGLRVGVSVANAIAYSLGIPVNGKKMETSLAYE
jgi:tRNA threonylcarbamoyladenosine biosynthesis protein TsaB